MSTRRSLAATILVVLAAACGDRHGATSATASRIQNLVVVIQENSSFDEYYARYCQAAVGSQPSCNDGPACCETGPATDPGSGLPPLLLDDRQHGAWGPVNISSCELLAIDGGRMDQFSKGGCGNPQNFAYADAGTVGPYWDLARRSALADRYFQPVAGASSGNDMYLARANFVFDDNDFEPPAIGVQCTGDPTNSYDDPTIGDLLADAGVPWTFYMVGYQATLDAVAQGTCPKPDPECPSQVPFFPCVYDASDNPFQYYPRFRDNPAYIRDFSQLARDLAAGNLPAVSFVKPIGFRSEHPGDGNTISAGVSFVTSLVDTVLASSYGDKTLILFTYDESGGFFDHVPPPPTSVVDGKSYGPRVPTMAIGPFARRNYISHVTLEHSSIVKFIEWNWLGKVTGQLHTRDAVANNLGSLLDPAATGVAVPE